MCHLIVCVCPGESSERGVHKQLSVHLAMWVSSYSRLALELGILLTSNFKCRVLLLQSLLDRVFFLSLQILA
jgi:hypothetical protein